MIETMCIYRVCRYKGLLRSNVEDQAKLWEDTLDEEKLVQSENSSCRNGRFTWISISDGYNTGHSLMNNKYRVDVANFRSYLMESSSFYRTVAMVRIHI